MAAQVTSGQEIEPVLEPKLTRDAALNLAAGRLRQRARTDKRHMASEDLMFVCHCFADSPDHVGDVDAAPVHALNLLDDHERFVAVLIRNREQRPPSESEVGEQADRRKMPKSVPSSFLSPQKSGATIFSNGRITYPMPCVPSCG